MSDCKDCQTMKDAAYMRRELDLAGYRLMEATNQTALLRQKVLQMEEEARTAELDHQAALEVMRNRCHELYSQVQELKDDLLEITDRRSHKV